MNWPETQKEKRYINGTGVQTAYASRGGLFYWTYDWMDCSIKTLTVCCVNEQSEEDEKKPLWKGGTGDLFLQLASGNDTAYFRRQAGAIEKAIREMRAKPGEFFYLKYCCCSEKSIFGYEEQGLGSYLTWEHIFERIREYLGYVEDDEKELVWFEVEKWAPDGTGRLFFNVRGFGISARSLSRRRYRDHRLPSFCASEPCCLFFMGSSRRKSACWKR